MHTRYLANLVTLAAAAVLTAACSDQSATTGPALHPAMDMSASSTNARDGAPSGTTAGWLNGTTVTFFYHKPFFCAEPPASGAPSSCEVGADGPDPRPGNIPILYVMTPIGFRPDASTLQCPMVGGCINHPSTIDLSRVFGPGAADVPLPAHSHIIDSALPESQADGGMAGWWNIVVIGVTDPAVWDQIVAGKSLATVRALQAVGKGITGDIPSNAYLFFAVKS
ncbi:MAG: hypothetical protein ACREOJ_16180 [Gemmatimonadaceae bacterium]